MALDPLTVALVVLAVVMAVMTWFELRYLRKSARSRRLKAAQRVQDLPDEAHNAMVTTKAIVSAMDRSGVHNEEVDSLMREAQTAYDRRNYRVALELTSQAKSRLMALKKERQAKGDLAKLETAPAGSGSDDEITTKERLQKDFPPNMLQAKFALSMAESSIEAGRAGGREVGQAQLLLTDARSRYEGKDYNGALSAARQADKSARGEPVDAKPSAPAPTAAPATAQPPARPVPAGSICPSCGAAVKEGDTFCRKCGAQVVLTACPTCGAALQSDDMFCRKCGARLVR